ncbi:PREDICTED: uncharacterized protein ZK546.14-like [Nicotiana attenuata]|uniref:uncharacterized protein ZK546.14-like n=1 Tax=Nicotiana attenuata TaxID=49451 RepID=UPI000904A5D9|nr:PREDICTED: uncharacterized protein ZK546.14-like [Nicotiana attenuata]
MVAVEKSADQRVQTANKFALLEEIDDGNNENNQLAIVEVNASQKSPVQKSNEAGRLNPVALAFRPTDSGIASSKVGNTPNSKEAGKGYRVTIDQDGNKLWHKQTEVDSEEGEVPDGANGEEESADEENDQEEQSVNNKSKGQETRLESSNTVKESVQIAEVQRVSEEEGNKQLLSPNPSKELPPADPNIGPAKPTGGTEKGVESSDPQLPKASNEEIIERPTDHKQRRSAEGVKDKQGDANKEQLIKQKAATALIPINIQQLAAQGDDLREEDNMEEAGRDFDEESTT